MINIFSAVQMSTDGTQSAVSMPRYLPAFIRIGICLLIVFSVYNYLRSVYYGRIISRIISAGAVSQKAAKSASELGLDSKLAKFWLRRRSTLRKLVYVVGEEAQSDLNSDNPEAGAMDKEQPDSRELSEEEEEEEEEEEAEMLKRTSVLRPAVPFDKALFYIPEGKTETAQLQFCDKQFDRKGSPATLIAGCILVVVLGELFLHFYREIITFVSNFFGKA